MRIRFDARTPEGAVLPGDLDGDGRTEDLNGNGRADDLVVLVYMVNVQPAGSEIPELDFDGNGVVSQLDTGALCRVLKAHWYANAQDPAERERISAERERIIPFFQTR